MPLIALDPDVAEIVGSIPNWLTTDDTLSQYAAWKQRVLAILTARAQSAHRQAFLPTAG